MYTKCADRFAGLAFAVISAASASADAGMSFMEPLIVPRPSQIEVQTNVCVSLSAGPVRVSCAEGGSSALPWAADRCGRWFGGASVRGVPFSGDPVPGGAEAYEIAADLDGVSVRANGPAGVRHAMYTLRQCAMPERGTLRTKGYIVPGMTVRDRPALGFRGVHLCWFPGVTVEEMERKLRLAAYYKFNYAVIEPWGVYKWRSTPDFCWPDAHVAAADVKRLVAVALDAGITLCPQLNMFGHAAMSRFIGGKHATLDLKPEYEPVFEPLGGWNWCLTNPETRRVLEKMIADLCDAFGNPPYFHIGCDEAERPSCPTCRSVDYSDLVLGHLKWIHGVLSRRGCRAMMWHDMLLERGDPRWAGFYAKGDAATAALPGRLPRDIVICDWYYREAEWFYPTMDYFASLGYSVLTCPWRDSGGIKAQAEHARSQNLLGILETTWHAARGRGFGGMMISAAHAGWGTSADRYAGSFGTIAYATHLRHVGWDMGLKSRESTGFVTDDVPLRPWVEAVGGKCLE